MEGSKDSNSSPSVANRKQLLSSISSMDSMDLDALLNIDWNSAVIKNVFGYFLPLSFRVIFI